VEYEIVLSDPATKLLRNIKDRREQQVLLARLEKLKVEPDKQGKALSEELSGYRSVRAVGQRYRIIYRVEDERVLIIALGRRKEGDKQDIYALTLKLLTEFESEQDPL
jgi:mRNA interferase RelE/StbE